MATKLGINESLLEQTKNLASLATKSETLNAVLREFIQARLRTQLLEARGQIDFHKDFNHKA